MIKQHNNVLKSKLSSEHESDEIITVKRILNSYSLMTNGLSDKFLAQSDDVKISKR